MAPAEHTLHGQHIGFREDELANPLPVLTLRMADVAQRAAIFGRQGAG
jgi:hypothetical protein